VLKNDNESICNNVNINDLEVGSGNNNNSPNKK